MSTRSITTLLAAVLLAGIASGARGEDAEKYDPDAKGLYVSQLKNQTENLNLGMTYWIERVRKGKTEQVSNKTPFYSGDQIKFHVRPNVDGFAYILLTSGSQGEQSVLFPSEKLKEDNQVQHGRDYALPSDGLISFDKHPGVERVTLLLSRKKIDGQQYLSQPHEKATFIASSSTGSKDFVPVQVAVSFGPQPGVDDWDKAKANPTTLESDAKKSIKKNATPVKKAIAKKAADTKIAAAQPKSDSVTVVKKDPGGILHIDIALDHRS